MSARESRGPRRQPCPCDALLPQHSSRTAPSLCGAGGILAGAVLAGGVLARRWKAEAQPFGSVETAATRAVEKPPLDLAERFVGGVEQASQIIALALIFFCQGYFWVLTWRIDEARNALELLFA